MPKQKSSSKSKTKSKRTKTHAELKMVNGLLVAFSDAGPLPDRDYVAESREERMNELMKFALKTKL